MLELERLAQQVVNLWETGQLAEAVNELATELQRQRDNRCNNARYIALARQYFEETSDDEIEIDVEPLITWAEDGCWINAWVMVRHDDVQVAEHD
jgi:hypothetical protein